MIPLPGLRWLCIAAVLGCTACAHTTQPGAVGVSRPQLVAIPSGQMEDMAQREYDVQVEKLRVANRLIETGPQVERVRAVMTRLVGHVAAFRDDAATWNWQAKLADRAELNASCLHGGRILVNIGILTLVGSSDDELAAILGHEMAHALREHGREKTTLAASRELIKMVLRSKLDRTGNPMLSASGIHDYAIDMMLMRPHSREAELEADRIGLELMARAGYDPAAALAVWRKMASATIKPFSWLSTHPAPEARLEVLESLQPVVRPLFEAAAQP